MADPGPDPRADGPGLRVDGVRPGTRPRTPGGEPLLLGPSLGTISTMLWGPVADRVRQRWDIAAWDLPGHGVTPAASGEVTMAELAASVLRHADEVFGPGRPFVYAGDSVGGAIGLRLLLDAPERVRAAVLLCTGAVIGTPQAWHERALLVREQGTAAVLDGSRQRWFGPDVVRERADLVEGLLRTLQDVDREGYGQTCGALAGFDVRHALGQVRAPVVAVAGAEDVATPVESLREIADGVPGARLVVLPGVGHLAPVEAPGEVAALVDDLFPLSR